MTNGDVIETIGTTLQAIGWVFLPVLLLPLLYLFLPNINILQSASKAIIRTIDSLSYAIAEIVKWFLPILVLVVAFTVFALSIFGQSWTKLFESADYLHASSLLFGTHKASLVSPGVSMKAPLRRMGYAASFYLKPLFPFSRS